MSKPKRIFTDIELAQIEALAAYNTIEQIAEHFGISERAFFYIKNENEDLIAAYNRGRFKAQNHVGSKLMRLVNKENLGAIKFYLETKCGWAKTQEMNVTTRDVTPKPMKAVVNFSKPPETANLTHDQVDKALDES